MKLKQPSRCSSCYAVFLEPLAIRLGAIYLVAKELALRITFTNKQIYERVFKIPEPTNDADLLFRMLNTHLENFKSEHAIVAVSLEAHPTKPVREQFGLFETTLRNPHQLSETLARLIALLGSERVGMPVIEETHRPDAFRMEPFSWSSNEHPSSSPSSPHREKGSPLPEGEGRVRGALATWQRVALRRFRPAVSASVLLGADTSAHLRSTEICGKVIEQRGPYLISGNWWDEKSWARAEWDLEMENGELVRAHQSEETWKVDGIYD